MVGAFPPGLAPNPLKANYKTIVVIAFQKMTLGRVLEGSGTFPVQDTTSALPSLSLTQLLHTLASAAVIDLITVSATKELTN